MSKVKLVYEKEWYDFEKNSDNPYDYTFRTITDTALAKTFYEQGLEVVGQGYSWGDYYIVVKSKDKKRILRAKVYAILSSLFANKIKIKKLK